MGYMSREAFHQASLDQALDRLAMFFTLSVRAEDENRVEEVHLLHRECRRWEWIASLIAATGVKDTRYADN